MELNVHESVSQAQQVLKRARKQGKRARKRARRSAIATIDAVRALDLHEPAQVAKSAAKTAADHGARRAGKHATVIAGRATKQKSTSAARHLTRISVMALAAGALIAVTVVMIRRVRASSAPGFATADSCDIANVKVDAAVPDEPITQNGSKNGTDTRAQAISASPSPG